MRPIMRKTVLRLFNYRRHLHLNLPEIHYLLDSKNPLIFRIARGVILLCCFCICLHQIVDRIFYYLSIPVAVDVSFNGLEVVDPIEMKICSEYNDYVVEKLTKLGTQYGGLIPIHSLLWTDQVALNYTKLWTFDNKTIISGYYEINKNGQRVEKLNSIRKYDEINVLGFCTSLKLRTNYAASFQIKIVNERIRKAQKNVILNHLTDEGSYMSHGDNFDGYWTISIKTHEYVNRNTFECVHKNLIPPCIKKCSLESVNKEVGCRLPFHGKEITLPNCNSTFKSLFSLMDSLKFYIHQTNINTECRKNCERSCNTISLDISAENIPRLDNFSDVNVKLDEVVTSFRERVIYDQIDLLIDVAGNLALFLGLTMLSMLNVSYDLFSCAKFKRLIANSCRSVKSIEYKFNRCYEAIVRVNEEAKIIVSKERSLRTLLKILIYALCSLSGFTMAQDRVRLYFRFPIRRVTEIEIKSHVTLPSVTACGTWNNLTTLREEFAIKNNVTRWCDVDLLDLFRFNNNSFTLEILWRNSAPLEIMSNRKSLQSVIKTHLGDCVHYKFYSTKYGGRFLYLFQWSFYFPKRVQCSNGILRLFTDHAGSDTYNILSEVKIQPEFNYDLDFYYITIRRLNVTSQPCDTEDVFNACRRACLRDRLAKANLCGLPFFPNMSDAFVECTSVSMAKESRQKYVEIAAGVLVGRLCQCRRKCEEKILRTTITTSIIENAGNRDIGFLMTKNVIENIVEVERYSLSSLFCDLGNICGISLGISVLVIAELLQSALSRAWLIFHR